MHFCCNNYFITGMQIKQSWSLWQKQKHSYTDVSINSPTIRTYCHTNPFFCSCWLFLFLILHVPWKGLHRAGLSSGAEVCGGGREMTSGPRGKSHELRGRDFCPNSRPGHSVPDTAIDLCVVWVQYRCAQYIIHINVPVSFVLQLQS